ncbi:MAG: molecular chaperone TorD family protein [Chloroflexi bacterium]|nr:molecular chaperone TorD family protein [Chloroflexota bacterium]
MFTEEIKEICQLFASVLDYPRASLVQDADSCARLLENYDGGAAERMRRFASFAATQQQANLEELYTQTFDVTPATTLYFGHHLFGETPKRSAFLVRLEEAYQEHQFSIGQELADHLCVMLRFLCVSRDEEFVMPLLHECILPILDKMEQAFPKENEGYQPAIASLRLFLRQVSRRPVKSGGS